ncbi:MAG: hypothetical protein PHW95_01650 [Patescibacteria group bacterium]|nr:hypothetical protein [Patescibacteria group bacterium]
MTLPKFVILNLFQDPLRCRNKFGMTGVRQALAKQAVKIYFTYFINNYSIKLSLSDVQARWDIIIFIIGEINEYEQNISGGKTKVNC